MKLGRNKIEINEYKIEDTKLSLHLQSEDGKSFRCLYKCSCSYLGIRSFNNLIDFYRKMQSYLMEKNK